MFPAVPQWNPYAGYAPQYRPSQLEAARARMAAAMVPQGAQYGAIGACGPNGCLSPMPPPPVPTPDPYCGPWFCQTISPFQIPQPSAAVTELASYEVTCGSRRFYACGISSCNDCGEILINFETGDWNISLWCNNVDAGVFNTDQCYCPVGNFCFDKDTPLVFVVEPFTASPSEAPVPNVQLWGAACGSIFGCQNDYGMPWCPSPPGYPGLPPGGGWGGAMPGGFTGQLPPGGGGSAPPQP